MSNKISFRRTFLCGVAFGALSLTGAAWAQEAETAPAEPAAPAETTTTLPTAATEEAALAEKVTVTGSLIKRSEFTSASPIQVITAEVAALEGLIDSGSIVQGSSIAAGSTQINGQFGGFVVDGGTGVNTVDLRGCGTTRTLVLINGKRPGPAGTRGAVGAFDFNTVPSSVVQRFDILKDSGSTIYGSDAVCGVVNVITRTNIDKPEFNFSVNKPFDTGGESYNASAAYGFDFDIGSIALAAQYQLREDLSTGDREYLDCTEDLVRDPASGLLIDRVNASVTRGSFQGRNCSNIYHNTVIDQLFGTRLIPSPDGVTLPGRAGNPAIPGYRPRRNGAIPGDPLGRNFYEDVLTNPIQLSTDAIDKRELLSFYGSGDFDFGGINSLTEVLFTNRKTDQEGWRQFFPDIRGRTTSRGGQFAYTQNPTYVNPLNTAALPITIWPSNNQVDADYLLVQSTFSGNLFNDWAWSLGGNYSVSDATYTRNVIRATQTGDFSVGGGFAPTYNPFTADFLSGNYGAALYNQLTGIDVGDTEYIQALVNGSVSGSLFELPAGALGVAVGFEVRNTEITDTPGEFTRSGDVWGQSTAGITKGDNSVKEAFIEFDVPLLKGVPFAEELTLSASGRKFDYDIGGEGDIYKVGLNWQVNPSVRLRSTKGTSFRAPALFELFLDSQTSFASQFSIDPCVFWEDSNNQNLRTNCAADGIPSNYAGLGASARVIAGGNGATLEPETSESFTAGFVLTPSFADFNLAVDYFEFEVNDQIAQLGAASILGACYFGESAQFATNSFCDLFGRLPGTDAAAPFSITDVRDTYLNINEQVQRGIDLETRYEKEFNFGTVSLDVGATWSLESAVALFAPGTDDGVDNDDANGTIGDPSFVGDALIQLDKGNFTYSWFTDYIGRTSNERFSDTPGGLNEPYFLRAGNVDYAAEVTIYHGASVRWTGDTWTFTTGINNIFDDAPPRVSAEAATLRGQTPVVGTQYDLLGRRAFVTVSKTF
jgi:iron complex outermembrane recepter protein